MLSNGVGNFLFAGTTSANRIRRALLAFDVASIVPSNAQLDSVTLTLTFSGPQGDQPETFWLHRLTSDWGEGNSKAGGGEGAGGAATTGDATWIHTFFDTEMWAEPGGDFVNEASAEAVVAAEGAYTWGSTTEMVADVRQWLDNPETSFGWIVLGDETKAPSDKRLVSRNNPMESNRPVLTVHYSTATATEDEIIGASIQLGENYPNPFRESTTIPLEVDQPQHVVLVVYDVLGRVVKRPLDKTLSQGLHHIDISAHGMPSGLYVYCFGDECRRMVVTR
ncbi:MAG: DNRLRE domain-containing protein [Bacteroidetes bacterium]|nr:DNRLRE domain-containing protein [Bacteroidota bacterium]